jgi:maltose-binding protein MalE
MKGKRQRAWREATDDSREATQIAIWGSMEAREAGMRKIAKTLSKTRGYRVTVEDAERMLHPPHKKG